MKPTEGMKEADFGTEIHPANLERNAPYWQEQIDEAFQATP
jgi:hypothetical protein